MAGAKGGRNAEIADELDNISSTLGGGRGRRLQVLAAELRGEKIEPTEQEKRDAAYAEEHAKRLREDAEAAEAAAKAAAQHTS